jgi:putative transposase
MTGQETQGAPQGAATIHRLCQLAGLSRAGYYRHFEASAPARADADLRSDIQRISVANRYYGYRRITAELRREGQVVNEKRVRRLMREDNLLCLRSRPFVPRTTDSRHDYPIVPNLIRDLVPTGIDQIWVADITYIRLGEAFIYLAVILDAFSRKVIGWALDDHLEARLAIEALDMALADRNPASDSLIHHSDRGVQYASNDYRERLSARGIAVSMSRVANPYDNAKAESFMKTLKAEEVNGKAYLTLDDARRDVGRFIDTVYNTQRLHSALRYKPPAEFEAELRHPSKPQTYATIAVSPI